MLKQTSGIVLFHFKYSDTSVIARIYTEAFGLQSYLIPGAKKKKSRFRASQLHPFSLLDLVVYNKPGGGLQRIREMSPEEGSGLELYSNVYKSSIAVFLSEVIYRCIKDEERDPEMFRFLHHAVKQLIHSKKDYINFHLWFLSSFTTFLGIQPHNNWREGWYFDLAEAGFTGSKPLHNYHCLTGESKLLHELFSVKDPAKQSGLKFNNESRRKVLRILLDYYRHHIDDIGEIKSIDILEEVMA